MTRSEHRPTINGHLKAFPLPFGYQVTAPPTRFGAFIFQLFPNAFCFLLPISLSCLVYNIHE